MDKRLFWRNVFIFLAILYMVLPFLTEASPATHEAVMILQYIIKPLLMPVLALYFFLASASHPVRARQWIITGLFFSAAGDTLLMFAGRDEMYFLSGLLAFLLAHLCYIAAFIHFRGDQSGYLSRNKMAVLPLLLFVMAFIALLWDDLSSSLRWPVTGYALVIGTMAASCLNLKGITPRLGFTSAMSGALAFMLSDSILALVKFKPGFDSIPWPHFWIMLTYLSGQFLIARGSHLILDHR